MKFHLTFKSDNRKTGPIPTSTSCKQTCPTTCPWRNRAGCYGDGGPLAIHWDKVSNEDRGIDWLSFLDQIKKIPEGQLWRHNQAGDLARNGHKIDEKKLGELVDTNRGRKGFTYTHHLVEGESDSAKHNRSCVFLANQAGFTINLSGDNLAHADRLFALNIAPVTVLLPHDFKGTTLETPAGNKVIVCPATYKNTVCMVCKLCAKKTRDYIIGFPVHGNKKKKMDV